jgi:hypothetical protein
MIIMDYIVKYDWDIILNAMKPMIEKELKKRCAHAFGDLSNSINGKVEENGLNIYGEHYWKYVEYGTYPHYVSADKLKAWCKLKLGDENLAWAVRGHIAKYGTKPQPFVREITNQKLEEYLIEALKVKGAIRLIQK